MAKPKPEAIKLFRGTWRGDRSIANTIKVDPIKIPTSPAYLNDDEKIVWETFRKYLQPLKYIAIMDLYSFEQLVRWVALTNKLWSLPESNVRDLDAANKNVKYWLGAFGMSPSDRASIRSLVDETDAASLEELLS